MPYARKILCSELRLACSESANPCSFCPGGQFPIGRKGLIIPFQEGFHFLLVVGKHLIEGTNPRGFVVAIIEAAISLC